MFTPESGLLTANGKLRRDAINAKFRENRANVRETRGCRRRSNASAKEFRGKALRWEWRDGVVELTLDREPLNEIGTEMLADLEKFAAAIRGLAPITSACVITSARPGGFCAGADLKELYQGALRLPKSETCRRGARIPEAHPQSDERDR